MAKTAVESEFKEVQFFRPVRPLLCPGASRVSFVCASDACVRPATTEEVLGTQPYLLFYQRASPLIL